MTAPCQRGSIKSEGLRFQKMASVEAVASGLCIIVGAALIYLATPHQKLARRVMAKPLLLTAGSMLVAIAAYLLMTIMGAATAIFTVIIVIMLLWSLPPLLIAWLRHRMDAQP